MLQPIAERSRRAEVEYWREVEKRLPLFWRYLNAVVSALRRRDEIPPLLPRMADFAAWVSAAELGLGWEPGAFLAAYTGNRNAAVERALEADVIGEPVCRLVESGNCGFPDWAAGSIGHFAPEGVAKSRAWPAVNKLRGRLRMLQPTLRERGIEMDIDPNLKSNDANRTRLIGIRRDRSRASP